MPTPRCPHCTNDAPSLLEALDAAEVMWRCDVCSKTFLNPSLSGASAVNAVGSSPKSSALKVPRLPVRIVET